MPRRAAVIRRWLGAHGCDDQSIQLSCKDEPVTTTPAANVRPAAMALTCAGEQQVVCTAWRRQTGGDRRRSMVKVPQLSSCASSGQCLVFLGSSTLPGRGRPDGRPATASGPRAYRLQSRRFHRL
eukprot:scaffold17184_cov76-Phaeocystis_antarctica.AAC.3